DEPLVGDAPVVPALHLERQDTSLAGAVAVAAGAHAGGRAVAGEVHVVARAAGIRVVMRGPGALFALPLRRRVEVDQRRPALHAGVALRIDPVAAGRDRPDERVEVLRVDGVELAAVDEDARAAPRGVGRQPPAPLEAGGNGGP